MLAEQEGRTLDNLRIKLLTRGEVLARQHTTVHAGIHPHRVQVPDEIEQLAQVSFCFYYKYKP